MKNQFLKKLSLNKETLVSLQDRQMQAVLGGQAQFYSSGDTSGCPSADCNDTCCKRSCRKAEEPVEQEVNP